MLWHYLLSDIPIRRYIVMCDFQEQASNYERRF